MIEKAPKLTQEDLSRFYINKEYKNDSNVNIVIDKVNENYEYWDTVKYKKCPDYCTAEELWKRVKMTRILMMANTWDKYNVIFGFTNKMQRLCQ